MQALLAAEGVPWWRDAIGLISIPALVALNGFFVAAEFALVKVRKTRIEQLISEGELRARAVEDAISNLDRAIAATQLGITLASLGLGWLGEAALEHIIRPLFLGIPAPFQWLASHSVAGTIAFLLITFMHVVFGELIPKTIALQIPERTALWVSAPLNVFTRLTRPLILLMNGTGALILRLFGYQVKVNEDVHTIEELALIVEDVEQAGMLDSEQADLVQNIFALSNKTVQDCMVPAAEMMALELRTSDEKVMEAVRRGGHTRIPIYDGELDNMVGIVNTKDLFYIFSLQGLVILADAMYPPIFLTPDETIANAMRLFKRSHKHMALVRDDDTKKILGLVTLEDILEEIIGEIEDEHDRPAFKVVLWRRRGLPPYMK